MLQFPPKPQRKINVEELYSIKNIFDVQISHLLQFEPNNIRTFLGFDNKFRCLHVFDYLISQKCFEKVVFVNKNQIEKPELINIKFNMFYIEIQNIFDCSLLFSIEYQNSFLFNNNGFCSNDFSTFLSFEKEEEMNKAKQLIKSLIQNNSPYAIKMLKFIDQKDILLLFPNEKLNENLFYMIIRLKYLNKTDISKINNEFLKNLQKMSKIVRYDLVPSLNNKRYFVVGFDNNQKRNDAFLNLKSKQFTLIQFYYNENLPNRKKLQLNVKEKEQNAIQKEPLFKPKDGMFYLYFEEYQRSKLNYPSSIVRPLFGIKNISDLQRNYFLPNDPKEYTFIGFTKEENVIELINQISLKKHIIYSNALNGKVYRFLNNKAKVGTNYKSPNLFKDTQKIINRNKDSINSSNAITLNSNESSIEINKNLNKVNQNNDNKSNKVNQNNDNKSNKVNSNNDNKSNKVNQNNNDYSNEISPNNNNCSNDINQNNNDYSNKINQNNYNYSNKIASDNIIDSNNVISKKVIAKAPDEKDKITEVKREDIKSKHIIKDEGSPKADNENNIKAPIQNKLVNNIYYNYINQKENEYLKIDLKKYEMKNLLGNGSYGDVFIVEEKTTNKKYAAKISKNNKNEDFIQEIYFYSKYKYPFILSIHGYSLTDFKNNNHITMVLDYMPNGSLEAALKKPDSLSKSDKYLIMYGIVIGMKYLHSKSVVHRDLKPANILLDENNYPRICDFGLSIIYSDKNKIVKKQEKEKVGSLMFMAPEIFLDKEPYSFKVDVYAFSMIAYQLLTGKEPYSDKKYKKHIKLKKDVIDGVRPDLSFIPDAEIRSFFKRCWSQEPSERPSFSQIYDMITAYKFRSVFDIIDFYITKFDYWYKNILDPFELDDSIIRKISSICPENIDINTYFSSIFVGDLSRFGIYGFRLFHGIGVQKNINAGTAIMAYAAKNGDTESLYLFAHCLHETHPYNPCVFVFLKQAADKGHDRAMNKYAKLLLEYYSTPETDIEAAGYLYMSATKGDAPSMCCYGTLLELGIGVKKDLKKALEYFQMSSELGCPEGIYQCHIFEKNLAFHIENGLGCQVDYIKASKYYEIASFYGDIKSMVRLGKMLNNGKLPYNIDQSIKYLREASKHENVKGMFEYGKALMIQVINNKEDIALPIKYYLKSIEKYDPDACFSYGNLTLLNAFFNFLENANSIEDSLKYFQLALVSSENKEIPMSFCALLTNQILYMNIETIIVEYGILILKNTLENHDLIIDCLLYYMIVKYFKKQYYETLIKTIDKKFPNKSHYLKYIIECVDSYSYHPYSNKCIVENAENDDNDDEFNELKLFAKSQIKNKSINDVKVNVYESFALDDYCCFSFSHSTIPKNILKEIDKYFKSLPEFISVHPYVCNPEDSNDLFTFYKLKLFSSKIPANEYCIHWTEDYLINKNNKNWEIDKKEGMDYIISTIRITQIHIQFEPIFERKGYQVAMGYCSGMPLDQNYLYFNEDYLPNDLLTHLLKYLHTIEDIRSIIPKVYNGRQIVTMIYIKADTEKKIVEKIKNFLSPKDILFKTFEYPLQSTIVLNENMIFKNKTDFLCVLNEIESIGIKPINVERDKLYLYEEFFLRKLFQKFSFICFKNEIDKMKALNHINSIVYKGKKNVLQYDLDLHYASLNDRCFPKYVRDLVPVIFQQIKGFKDIQRNVLSIESPVERTYVGFDSHKHLKKCYYKFTYKKNLVHFRKNTDNVFWRKNNYKYLMIERHIYQDILDQYPVIIKQIMQSSKDFQENCRELDQQNPELEKRNVLIYYNFIGYETNEDLDKAFNFLDGSVLNAKPFYKKYHEGYSYVDIINDPKEAYLFYNSL